MKRFRQRGQGLVEYAGALILAFTLVIFVMLPGSDDVRNLVFWILDTLQAYFVSQVANLT